MNERRKQILRRTEVTALVICTTVLAGVLGHNVSSGRSRLPTTIVLSIDARGVASFKGVSLANPCLRRTLFRVFKVLDYEVVTTGGPRGWMRNPTVKSNLWSLAEDVEGLGLSPGDRALRQRNGVQ
jgi:hypothetical protein